MLKADLIADAKEVMGDMADLAQTWTTVDGSTSWQVLIGMPSITQELMSGGFMERTNHEVRIVASNTSWTTAYGSACAAAINGTPLASVFTIGMSLMAVEQNLKYRVIGSAYKPGSAWVTLTVRLEDER